MDINETRILDLPSSRHAIVSMPKTAWYWLDDLVQTKFPVGGYKALLREFNKADTAEALSRSLRGKAQEYCNQQMEGLYSLANDNTPAEPAEDLKVNAGHPLVSDLSARMPFAYWLFHFLPHPTYLTTVWERRNYHLREPLDD